MPRPAFVSLPLTGASAAGVCYLGAARARRKFELYYPDGFADETYLIAERSTKERAHVEWQAELGPAEFRKLLARGEFRQIADIAIRIESRTNLLFSFEKMALRDALRTPAGARLFAHELYAFLHGRGAPQRRFQDWVQAVKDLPQPRGKVLTWPVVTVFGFLARPDRHLFLKPRVTRRAARAYGYDFGYGSEPSWPVYHGLLTFGAIIRRDLDRRPGLRARDMIDVQSFIWVQGADEYDA
ncbi:MULTISPECIES: hypothetical protein [Ramlibacter]|jgi:hypothetical protein|uniref:Uncharacterized protein n=1 Tax=Ramlibacter pinisoli TaxID=2682844 RepID=A0A6N8INA5_9BURK|nr:MULTISPECIES: hypothetical protein [Ramlibacter]MBA2960717.1 hypothetical protein [Ramlibacter sp. CGMCC 1.13660]MVQ28045.1 hypothetical protein [Ramlibacter pinisoli]